MEFLTVANPTFIPIAFAANGLKNPIQKTRQPTQDAQDMTWNDGSPLITLTPIEDGGKAPKGQDFNGVMNVVTEHGIFIQNGNRYKWSADVVTNFGGYAKDSIVQSDDGLREYISLIDNNATNPNSSVTGTWSIYAGNGSVPTATSTVAGIMTVINNLTSTNVGSALSAAMGMALSQAIDLKLNISNAFGVGQNWGNYTSLRSLGVTYTNNTTKPIEVQIGFPDSNNRSPWVTVYVNGVLIISNQYDSSTNYGSLQLSFTVPAGQTYQVNEINSGYLPNLWTELR